MELLPFASGYRRAHGASPGLGDLSLWVSENQARSLCLGNGRSFLSTTEPLSSEVQGLPLLGDPSNLPVSHNKGQNYALSLMHSHSVGQLSSTNIMESLKHGCPHPKPIPVALCRLILDVLRTLPERVSSFGIVLILSESWEDEVK